MTEPRQQPPFRAWTPDPLRLRDRLAARFRAAGYAWPDFAADVIAWRGMQNKTLSELAAAINVAEAEIAAAEAGELDPDSADPALVWGARRHAAALKRRLGRAGDPNGAP